MHVTWLAKSIYAAALCTHSFTELVGNQKGLEQAFNWHFKKEKNVLVSWFWKVILQ